MSHLRLLLLALLPVQRGVIIRIDLYNSEMRFDFNYIIIDIFISIFLVISLLIH
jgi:hypothetical protein